MTDTTKKPRAYFAYLLSVLRLRRFALLSIAATGLVVGLAVLTAPNRPVAAATSDNLNFQARLQSASGNIVPDGYYNIQFKLYDALSGGTNLWTESYYDSNGTTAGNDNRVRVVNGYVTVNLGSQTAFPGSIPWDQQLYLTMNVGGTTQTATPTYDGEMSPRLKLTAVPYAFNAKTASQLLTTNGAFTSTLQLQPTASNQVFQIPDQGSAGTYNLLTAASGIQNQYASAQTADFWLSGRARAQGQTILGGSTNQTQLIVRANASQTAANPLIMLQDSSGAELSRINATGSSLFIGKSSGINAEAGALYNTALGSQALESLTTGDGNMAIGEYSLHAVTTGSNNIAIGVDAMGYSITSASNNTAIGTQALLIVNGNNNVGIGYMAGDTDYGTNGSDGQFFTGHSPTLQNAAAIGAFAQVQNNNSMVLGSVDLGIKVGIGTTIPLNTFSVSPVYYSTGTASQSGNTVTGSGTTWTAAMVGMQFIFANGFTGTVTGFTSATSLTLSTSQTVGSQAYRIHKLGLQVANSSGFVGVNNAAPASELDVTGTIRTSGGYNIGATSVITSAAVLQNVTANTSILTAGTLGYGRGGTGSTSYTTNGVVYAGASGLQSTAAGTTGQCLVATSSAAPSWGSCGLAAEADTLQSVTDRGATTTTAVILQGGATIRGVTVDSATATTDTLSLSVSAAATGTSYLGTITNANLTAARTWTLPNLGGTVALTSNNQTFTNTQTFSGTLASTGTTNITGAASTIGDAASDSLTIGATIQGTNALLFEGSAADANDLTLAITNPTGARTITLPDVTGTVITTGNLSGITGLADSQISDTLTASILVGSGSTTNAVDLATAEVNGTLGVGNGGTGATSLTQYGVIYGNAAGALQATAAGTTGQCLVATSSAAPSWGTCGSWANTTLSNLTSPTNINQALNTTSGNLSLTTTTSGNIVLNAAGFTDLQDTLQNSAGTLTISDALDINVNANNAVNINTGTSTGAVTIGGSATGAIQLQSASSITLKGSSTADGDMLVKTTATNNGPSSLFSDGFESGGLTNWTSGGGVTVTNTGARTGTYRANIASGGTGKWQTKTVTTSSYVSFVAYVKMPTTPTSTQYFMAVDTTSYGNSLAYEPNAGSPRFYLYSDSGGGSGGGSPTTFSAAGATWNANAWNKVEMQVTGNTTTNSIRAYLNDVAVGTWSINLTSQSITDVVIGTGNAINFNLQYDDIQVNGPDSITYSGGNLTVERTLTINSDGTYSQRLCHNQADGATTNMKLGDCSSGGADLAEYYNSDGSAEPGDIVVPVASGPTIGRSSAIYQANMMGVVSTNPTVDGIMGSTSTNKASRLPVALAGRVPLKVSLENGPIRAGDPLTASSIAGVAMKATKPGQIIGTALEDYDETSSSVSKAVQYEEAERNRLHMLELPQYQSDPSKWAPGVGKIMVLSKVTYYDPSGVLQEIGSTVSLLQAQVSALQRGASLLDGTNFNGDLTVKGSLSVTGDLAVMGAVRFAGTTETADITIRGHITSGGTAPAVSAGRALGAATLASKPHVTVQGTDTAGTVTMNSAATDTTSGALATVAFTKPYNGPYHVVVSAQNDATAALQLYVVKTATGFDILSRTPLAPNLQYQADYMVLGTAQ